MRQIPDTHTPPTLTPDTDEDRDYRLRTRSARALSEIAVWAVALLAAAYLVVMALTAVIGWVWG